MPFDFYIAPLNHTGSWYNVQMKLTLKNLNELFHDNEYRRYPVDVVQNTPELISWWDFNSALGIEGAKATVWEAGMMIAALFDTYGSVIRNVGVEAWVSVEEGSTVVVHQIYINGARSWEHRLLNNEEELDECYRVDQAEVLKEVIVSWENSANNDLASQVEKINSYFVKNITSAQQARDIARGAAPGLDSWVRAKLLTQEAGLVSQNKSEGVGPKM